MKGFLLKLDWILHVFVYHLVDSSLQPSAQISLLLSEFLCCSPSFWPKLPVAALLHASQSGVDVRSRVLVPVYSSVAGAEPVQTFDLVPLDHLELLFQSQDRPNQQEQIWCPKMMLHWARVATQPSNWGQNPASINRHLCFPLSASHGH